MIVTGKPSICFVALNCYNLISQRSDLTHVGGAEVQQYLMARWLVDQGYSVSFVTLDHGQPASEEIDGIRIYKAYNKASGFPVVRFFTPRWTGLNSALTRANADIYYQRGAGLETGQVKLWCRSNSKKFIFAVASDTDCSARLPLLTAYRERWLYRYGLRNADAVIAQTNVQKELLLKEFGVHARLIRSSGKSLGMAVSPESKDKNVLWVGRISPQKRFDLLLATAERRPDCTFIVVGDSNMESQYAEELLERAAQIPNVQIKGAVPRPEMLNYYNQSRLLYLTSDFEGFPNVFIEAWQLGLPVLSTLDPDNLVAENKLGWVSSNVDGLVACLDAVIDDLDLLAKFSKNVIEFYEHNHALDNNMPNYERVYSDLTRP